MQRIGRNDKSGRWLAAEDRRVGIDQSPSKRRFTAALILIESEGEVIERLRSHEATERIGSTILLLSSR